MFRGVHVSVSDGSEPLASHCHDVQPLRDLIEEPRMSCIHAHRQTDRQTDITVNITALRASQTLNNKVRQVLSCINYIIC